MQFLLSIFFGMVASWAIKRKNAPDALGHWRLAAGAAAGAIPHMDFIFRFFGARVYAGLEYGPTWSWLLAPLYALAVAYALARVSHRNWQQLFPVVAGSLYLILLMSLFTNEGVRPLWPLVNWHVALNLIYPLDLSILAICLLTLGIGLALGSWRRDIARIGLLMVIGYMVAVTTFHFKAANFAERYATAFRLEVSEVHTIPQPISPFNWRLIVKTEDEKLHDTLINLFREEEKEVREDSTRAARIDALYKPLNKAVWRIYSRFGTPNPRFARSAWTTMMTNSSQFAFHARFAVFKEYVKKNGNTCALFGDLRYEGARDSEQGQYLICREGREAVVYRPDGEGGFSRFDMMY